LRLSDLDYLDAVNEEGEPEPSLRARFNREGPLKEDKDGSKAKMAPASQELAEMLRAQRKRREDAGAEPEAFVFVSEDGSVITKMHLSREWRRMRKALELPETIELHSSTRHTSVNRWIESQAPTETISRALGHSDERVTRKHYQIVSPIRFPSSMRQGLGLTTNGSAALSVSK
jgi:integrase